MNTESGSTLRRRIRSILLEDSCSVRDLSQLLRESEKEILSHLPHVARSAVAPRRFSMEPAVCLQCGFVFRKRGRLTTPGKCPICRNERIEPPRFRIR